MAREFTDEQKKAWKEQMKEREDQAKEQIHDLARSFRDTPEQIQEFLTFEAKFYQYSARNTMLIYKQNRGATFVQSFKTGRIWDIRSREGNMVLISLYQCNAH